MAGINPFSTIQEMPRWEGVPQSFVEWIVRMILRMNTTKASDQANYQSRSRFRACDVPWNNDFEIFPDTEVVADGWERDFETTGTVSDANYGRSKTPYKGTYAQQIKTTGSNGVSLACRPIPVKDETKYTLTAQAKIDNASSAQDGFYARVVWYNTDADFSRAGAASLIDVVSGSANFFTANDTYTAVSGEVSVPAGAKFARIAFYSWTQAGAARTITVDGVTFVQTTIPLSAADGDLDDIEDGNYGFKIHWNEKLYLKQLSSWSHNLLINFSFEYTGIDAFLYGWFSYVAGGTGAFNIRNDYTKAKTGNNYGELSGNAEVYSTIYAAMPYGYLGRLFEVNAGETFTASAWVYIETAGANTVINLNVSEHDRSGTWVRANTASTTTSGSWVQLTKTFTVPAGTKYLQLYLTAYNAVSACVVRVDDVIFLANSPTFTVGSVPYAGVAGVLSQDNANFFWDAANARLGIGDTTPTVKLGIRGANESVAAGPNIECKLGTNAYPSFQFLAYSAENLNMQFDCYHDGTSWKSANANSNFQIYKGTTTFQLRYAAGVAVGETLTWTAGLTLSSAGVVNVPGTLQQGGVGVVIAPLYKTYTWIIKGPGVGWVPGPYIHQACTALRIDAYVAAATNAAFNIEVRTAPGTAGSDLNNAEITATTAGVSDTTLQNTAIAAGKFLVVDISGVNGTPGYVAICLTVSVP